MTNPLFNWVGKNWLTVVGIIIILALVWYDVETVHSRVKEKVDECIIHYETEIAQKCSSPGFVPYNMSNIGIEIPK